MPMSNYLREAVLNWLRSTAFPVDPATLHISLHTADPGLAGTSEVVAGVGYSRQAVAVPAGFSAPANVGSDEVIDNTGTITFGPATGAGFGTVTHFAVWDASTGGNLLWTGTTTTKTVAAGDSYKYDPGNLDLLLQ